MPKNEGLNKWGEDNTWSRINPLFKQKLHYCFFYMHLGEFKKINKQGRKGDGEWVLNKNDWRGNFYFAPQTKQHWTHISNIIRTNINNTARTQSGTLADIFQVSYRRVFPRNVRSLEIVVIFRLVIKTRFVLNEWPLVFFCRKHTQTISGSSKAVP